MVTGYEVGFYRAVEQIAHDTRRIADEQRRAADALERIAEALTTPQQPEAATTP